jgi:uncharacterized protein
VEPPPPRRSPRLFRWLLLLCGMYLVVLSLAKLFENKLVYPAMKADQSWRASPSPRIQDVELTSTDGTPIHAWWLPPESGETNRAVLVCHGNGGNLTYRGKLMVELQAHLKCGVMQFDYPGYGKSGGEPSETGCYAAGESAHAWLTGTKTIPAEQIVLFGESLGGGVATELATRHPARALVLHATFTSLPAAARARFWFLPCDTLMANRFDSLSKLDRVKCPVFVCHGTNDRTVPFAHAEEMFQAAGEPKRFVRREGMGHNDPLEPAVFCALAEFVK